MQRQLYSAFLTHVRGEEGVTDGGAPSVRRLIGGYQTMQQIFNHPSTLYRNLASQGPGNKPTRQSGYDSMDDFMVTEDDTSGDSDAGNGGGGGGGGRGGGGRGGRGRGGGGGRSNGGGGSGGSGGGGGDDGGEEAAAWHSAAHAEGSEDHVTLSGKTRVFFALLRSAAAKKERTLLFSHSGTVTHGDPLGSPLAVPRLGSCACLERSWRHRAAHSPRGRDRGTLSPTPLALRHDIA